MKEFLKKWVFLQSQEKLPKKPVIYIGCMTGTSADNSADFTAAMFDAEGYPICYRNEVRAMPEALQKRLCQLSCEPPEKINIVQRCETEQLFTHFLAEAYQSIIHYFALENYSHGIVLSPHGQTINHRPLAQPPYCDILVNGDQLAHATGYKTVTRHRQAPLMVSMAAPLAPVLIKKLFFSPHQHTVLLNGGGIANICILFKDPLKPIIGYDTGPANGPLDMLIQWIIDNHPTAIPADLAKNIMAKKFDDGGEWASRGHVDERLFHGLMNHAYFKQNVNHKSADRASFNLQWILDHWQYASQRQTQTSPRGF